jgi:hypothetical protein
MDVGVGHVWDGDAAGPRTGEGDCPGSDVGGEEDTGLMEAPLSAMDLFGVCTRLKKIQIAVGMSRPGARAGG